MNRETAEQILSLVVECRQTLVAAMNDQTAEAYAADDKALGAVCDAIRSSITEETTS